MLTADSSPRTIADIRAAFRRKVALREALIVPGTANALGARIIEDLGFEAVYLSGAGLANTYLGMPDLGLITANELADAAMRIADITTLPLIVDIDTGFGNALNVQRTVRTLERAGASALQIEDQVFPKKCGHFSGKAVIPLPEMLGKLKAALDARTDANMQIIARTDVLAISGLEEALRRAHAFIEAGADIIFVEAPRDLAEMRQIGALPAPQVANIVYGGRTPVLTQQELSSMGFAISLYANAALQATIHAMGTVLSHLRDTGSLVGCEDRLAGFDERQRIVGKSVFDDAESRYAGA